MTAPSRSRSIRPRTTVASPSAPQASETFWLIAPAQQTAISARAAGATCGMRA